MALNKIWVLVVPAGEKVAPVSLELLTKARQLASTVEGVTWGEAGAFAAEYSEQRQNDGDRNKQKPKARPKLVEQGALRVVGPDLLGNLLDRPIGQPGLLAGADFRRPR